MKKKNQKIKFEMADGKPFELEFGSNLIIGASGKGKSIVAELCDVIINCVISELSKTIPEDNITSSDIKSYLTIEKVDNLIPLESSERWNGVGKDYKTFVLCVISANLKE